MDTKICTICNQRKTTDKFYKSQRGRKCIDCFLEKGRKYKKDRRSSPDVRELEGQKQKERRTRLWQNTLINDSKKRGKEHNLTVKDIDEIHKSQNGLCYWFNIPLIPSDNKKNPQQPSLDRLDQNKGYIKGNVVLSCYSANIGRNENDLETWKNFLNLLLKQ